MAEIIFLTLCEIITTAVKVASTAHSDREEKKNENDQKKMNETIMNFMV